MLHFMGKKQFLFDESKLFLSWHPVSKKYPHPHLEVRQIMKIASFSAQPLINSTCRNSLINQLTNRFYFGILIRVENETDCEILIDQWR